MPVNAAWLLNAYPDAYICAKRIKLAFPLIDGALPFALPLDLALGAKSIKHLIGLILGELAKLHELRTLDEAMHVDVVQRHLLLLDWLVAGLADIGGIGLVGDQSRETGEFGMVRVQPGDDPVVLHAQQQIAPSVLAKATTAATNSRSGRHCLSLLNSSVRLSPYRISSTISRSLVFIGIVREVKTK